MSDGNTASRRGVDVGTAIIGAGMSGLLMGIRLKQAGRPFRILEKAGSVEPEAVRDALPGVTIASPLGELAVLSNHHVRKATLIGEVQPDGQFKILHAEEPIIPTAWSPWLPENEGFVCDFSQERPDASRFRSGESGDDP